MEDALVEARKQPNVTVACTAAIVVPSFVIGIAGLLWMVAGGGFLALVIAFYASIFALIVAAAHVLLLGLPAYLLVRRFVVPDWRLCGACGLTLGVAPLLLFLAASGGDPRHHIPATLLFALMGLIGGISFRWWLYAESED